jgi:hypothetical protein
LLSGWHTGFPDLYLQVQRGRHIAAGKSGMVDPNTQLQIFIIALAMWIDFWLNPRVFKHVKP